MPFEPHQSLAGCITNIRPRLPGCDRVIADYSTRSHHAHEYASIHWTPWSKIALAIHWTPLDVSFNQRHPPDRSLDGAPLEPATR
jgi:hypothetical protein